MLDIGGEAGVHVSDRSTLLFYGLIGLQSPFEENRTAQPRAGVIVKRRFSGAEDWRVEGLAGWKACGLESLGGRGKSYLRICGSLSWWCHLRVCGSCSLSVACVIDGLCHPCHLWPTIPSAAVRRDRPAEELE